MTYRLSDFFVQAPLPVDTVYSSALTGITGEALNEQRKNENMIGNALVKARFGFKHLFCMCTTPFLFTYTSSPRGSPLGPHAAIRHDERTSISKDWLILPSQMICRQKQMVIHFPFRKISLRL